MTQITVSDELARQIAGASPPIVFVDACGRALGQITQVDPEIAGRPDIAPEDWTEIKQRAQNSGKYSTLQEIKERLGWQDQK